MHKSQSQMIVLLTDDEVVDFEGEAPVDTGLDLTRVVSL